MQTGPDPSGVVVCFLLVRRVDGWLARPHERSPCLSGPKGQPKAPAFIRAPQREKWVFFFFFFFFFKVHLPGFIPSSARRVMHGLQDLHRAQHECPPCL